MGHFFEERKYEGCIIFYFFFVKFDLDESICIKVDTWTCI